MTRESIQIEPTDECLWPVIWRLDRRRFLRLTGLAGLGLASGVGRAFGDDEMIKPTDAATALATAPLRSDTSSPCTNSPFGGPFYHGMPDITPENGPARREKAAWDLDHIWPIGQNIVVKFLNGQNVPDPALRTWFLQVQQKVRDIAPTWCDYANVGMQFVTDGPCHMTVNFVPFVDPVGGPMDYGVFNCFIGKDCMKVKSKVQSMNLLFNPNMQQWPPDFRESEFHRLIQHEFGHALALIHEHQRPDRGIVWMQSLYTVALQKWGWGPEMVNQQILPIQPGANFAGTVFDPTSIMMYEYPAGVGFYQKQGAPPNTPDLSRPFSSQRNTELSTLDKVSAAVIYPNPNAPRIGLNTLEVGGEASAGKITEGGQVAPFKFRPDADGNYTITVSGTLPVLVGLLNDPISRRDNGNLASILAGAESTNGPGATLQAENLKGGATYYVQLWHQKPMRKPDATDFSIKLARAGA